MKLHTPASKLFSYLVLFIFASLSSFRITAISGETCFGIHILSRVARSTFTSYNSNLLVRDEVRSRHFRGIKHRLCSETKSGRVFLIVVASVVFANVVYPAAHSPSPRFPAGPLERERGKERERKREDLSESDETNERWSVFARDDGPFVSRSLVYAFPLGRIASSTPPSLYVSSPPSKETATRKRPVSSNDVVELLRRALPRREPANPRRSVNHREMDGE